MHLTLSLIPPTARVTRPARSLPQVFRGRRKNPLLSLRFGRSDGVKVGAKERFGALSERKCGRNVAEVWTKCGVRDALERIQVLIGAINITKQWLSPAQKASLCCDWRYVPAAKATRRSLGNELNTLIANLFARKSARSFCCRGIHSNRTSIPRFSASLSSRIAPRKAG
jgi:hypothetical protein